MRDPTEGKGASADSASKALRPQLPVVLPLLESRRETPRTVTLFFPMPRRPEASFDPASVVPGQFVMVWLVDVDEKPYAVSYLERERFGITVMRRGRFSSRLHEIGAGTQVGFRGPYGRGFWGWQHQHDPCRVALVAGGCGTVPLAMLGERLSGCVLVQGEPTADEVLFAERFPDQVIYTEDGSRGRRGLPTEWLEEAVERGGVQMVYTCGPEALMRAVVSTCRRAGVSCQASLERYMKCGFGVCGQCECDGRLVCQDGPVFSAQELAHMPSFGRQARLKTGQRAPIPPQSHCEPPPGEPGSA